MMKRPPTIAAGRPQPSTYAWSGGSTRKWRRARAAQLEREPLCHDCRLEGRLTPAEHVHHVVELSKGGNRYDPSNMLSLCQYHHARRHGAKPRGANPDGTPRDPEHPWSRE